MAFPEQLGRSLGILGEQKYHPFQTDIERFGPPTSAGGFMGVLAGHIAFWKERGLGRAFGFTTPPETSYDKPTFHGVMFALPLTDLTDSSINVADHSVLLLAPFEEGCRFVVVKPKQYPTAAFSKAIQRQVIKTNEGFFDEFRSLFLPSTTEHTLGAWNSQSLNPLGDFYLSPNILSESVEPNGGVPDHKKSMLLNKALRVAWELEIKRKAFSESTLVAMLGEEVSTEFGQQERRFRGEIYAAEVREARIRELVARKNDMGDEGALLERLGDEVVDTLSAVSDELRMEEAAAIARQRGLTEAINLRVATTDIQGTLDALDFPVEREDIPGQRM